MASAICKWFRDIRGWLYNWIKIYWLYTVKEVSCDQDGVKFNIKKLYWIGIDNVMCMFSQFVRQILLNVNVENTITIRVQWPNIVKPFSLSHFLSEYRTGRKTIKVWLQKIVQVLKWCDCFKLSLSRLRSF